MDHGREHAEAALRRWLSNGPLTAVPKRPADQRLLALLAAARFAPGKDYREGEVNATLEAWLGTFCAPFGIDHVTLRRMIVDARLLQRTASGSTYAVHPDRAGELQPLAALEPAAVLAQVRDERAARKDSRAA